MFLSKAAKTQAQVKQPKTIHHPIEIILPLQHLPLSMVSLPREATPLLDHGQKTLHLYSSLLAHQCNQTSTSNHHKRLVVIMNSMMSLICNTRLIIQISRLPIHHHSKNHLPIIITITIAMLIKIDYTWI